MKKALLIAAAALLAGCASRGELQVGSGNSGSSFSSSSAGLQVQSGGSNFVTLLGLGIIAVASYRAEAMRDRAFPFQPMDDARASFWTPELAPDRRVNEQDCTKPIEDWSANLKCR